MEELNYEKPVIESSEAEEYGVVAIAGAFLYLAGVTITAAALVNKVVAVTDTYIGTTK